jgi:hypothetical protein
MKKLSRAILQLGITAFVTGRRRCGRKFPLLNFSGFPSREEKPHLREKRGHGKSYGWFLAEG